MKAYVIAMACEAEAVRPALKAGERLYVSGVGKVNAAAATQKAICEGATEIVNAGVAGGLNPAMNVGEVYEVARAVEYDFDLAKINGTQIGVHNERTTPYFACVTTGAFPARTLASGDRFNDDEADMAVLGELGADLRDMEGAAIAHVCELNNIPFRSIKCLSDVHGKGAMTSQYKDNLKRALESLGAIFCGV